MTFSTKRHFVVGFWTRIAIAWGSLSLTLCSRRTKLLCQAVATWQAAENEPNLYVCERRPLPPESSCRFRENDGVVLTGLKRAEMNGNVAVVRVPDCGGGRREIQVEETGSIFKVKFENIKVHFADESILD
jgi:hypothetical protein